MNEWAAIGAKYCPLTHIRPQVAYWLGLVRAFLVWLSFGRARCAIMSSLLLAVWFLNVFILGNGGSPRKYTELLAHILSFTNSFGESIEGIDSKEPRQNV